MEKKKKIIVWTKGIDDLIHDKGMVGGLTIQMYFWSLTFIENGWNVYSFSDVKKDTLQDIRFLKFPRIKTIGIFLEWFISFYYLLVTRPDIIIIRGARRELFFLVIYQKIFRYKLSFFGASDSDFEIGKELISVSKVNVSLYRKGVKKCKYFVVQSEEQQNLLREYYNKDSMVIKNIWCKNEVKPDITVHPEKYDAIWVGNFRKLKRPEYFVNLAKRNPGKKFVMIGGCIDFSLFDSIKIECQKIDNIDFLGTVSFNEIMNYFSNSKLLICSSEIEGFPNTFIQAFSAGMPIISTFDPSKILSESKLGHIVENEDELNHMFNQLISNKDEYLAIQENCFNFFKSNFDTKHSLNRFLNFLEREK
jgi:glycosyltransferase involved in cell wall biosynthesis